jgi:ethanolamine utilization protein EutA (predicted chaperonin)
MRIHWQWSLLPFASTDDVCAFKAALTFIDAVTEIFSAILSGHTLVVFPREVVKNVGKFIQVLLQLKYNVF